LAADVTCAPSRRLEGKLDFMQDFEKLGVFYLGKTEKSAYLYDSKDLVTHAVCVGMTGSGKTGLCLALLEEAAIDGIPALVIDPKGDLGNLLLTFPELRPEDFRPWVNEDEARQKGISPDELSAATAMKWKQGLEKWGQDGKRIGRLRAAADFAIYTPGSSAGLPVSVLRSFDAPPEALREDREAMRERITSTATALLALIGIDADPIDSREHILISKILDNAWNNGESLDIAALIHRIQTPPVDRIGVMELEAFFPAKERFSLAMSLNNLLASPGFEAWLEGEALDIDRMLYTPEGKPRISIFSIAHLNDAERMFFVSLLLNQTLSWMRTQPGTTSLRALLYMDEIFGYFPPIRNPPSKQPLLTLLKQSRAFGLGVVLATQNPVDLDYKGLANAGTWFIGRLQTERDKMRVLEGLEGASAAAGGQLNRQALEQLLASLGSRVFLVNNVHEPVPEVFESRWAMSYLAGPLTRTQIKLLMKGRRAAPATPVAPTAAPRAGVPGAMQRPVLPPEITQYFLPASGAAAYTPVLLGAASIRFTDAKLKVDITQENTWVTDITSEAVPVLWENAEAIDVPLANLETAPVEEATFGPLPQAAAKAKTYAAWNKEFIAWLTSSQPLELYRSPGAKAVSQPGESERDFRIRLGMALREERDQAVEKLRRKYAPKRALIEERIRRAGMQVQKESQDAASQMLQSALSAGAGLLGAFLGKKAISSRTVGAAASAARSMGRVAKERGDVGRATENLEALERQLADLDAEIESQVKLLEAAGDPLTEQLETIHLKPRKSNVTVRLFSLAWRP
jgi:hypothetical protein